MISDELEVVEYANVYPCRDLSRLYFFDERPNPLFLYENESNERPNPLFLYENESNERLNPVVELDEEVRDAIQLYTQLSKKWKWFTIISTVSVSLSYILGLVEHGSLDLDAISYPDRRLMMGMISWYPDCQDNRDELWRLVSNIFSHAGFSHFAGNIVSLYGFSFMLELYQPYYIIGPLFVVGVIDGSLAFYYTKPYRYALGVSHGVFSIIGMNFANGILNRCALPRLHIGFILYITLMMMFAEYLSYDESKNIAYICHWTSLVSGILGGFAFLLQYKPTWGTRIISGISMLLYGFLTGYLFVYYAITYPPTQSYTNTLQPTETVSCCYEWFKHKRANPNSTLTEYQCPYRIIYGDNFLPDMPHRAYKT